MKQRLQNIAYILKKVKQQILIENIFRLNTGLVPENPFRCFVWDLTHTFFLLVFWLLPLFVKENTKRHFVIHWEKTSLRHLRYLNVTVGVNVTFSTVMFISAPHLNSDGSRAPYMICGAPSLQPLGMV